MLTPCSCLNKEDELVDVKELPLSKYISVRKHVSTIHSASDLTLVQMKIVNVLLYAAFDDLLTRDV